MDLFITRRGGKGGSGDLNFEVVGGVTQPTNPRENTIWVNTSNEITGWIFSFEEPSVLHEGMVFFGLVKSGKVTMNAIKENGITISFKAARQVIGNELVKVEEAQVFINGAWVVLSGAQIYDDGEWHSPYTGFITNNCTITEYADHLHLVLNNKSGVYVKDVNFDEADTLMMDIVSDSVGWITIAVSDHMNWYDLGSNGNYMQYMSFQDTVTGPKIERGIYPLDVSNISGTHHIVINSWSSRLDVYSITLQ